MSTPESKGEKNKVTEVWTRNFRDGGNTETYIIGYQIPRNKT